MEKNLAMYAQYMKALSDETRLKIFLMLSDGELCACKILKNLTLPNLPFHTI